MVYVPAISLGINLPVAEHLPRHPLKPCVLDTRTYRTQYGPDVGHRGYMVLMWATVDLIPKFG